MSESSRPVYLCRPAASRIAVDGLLSERPWKDADPAHLRLHDDSKDPTFGTAARMCYDDEYLYVAFECHDREIQAGFENRDDPIYDEEVVEIFLDTDSDELTYYEFEFSPRNVIFDAVVENPTGVEGIIDTSWDCPGLRSAIQPMDSSKSGERIWTAEVAIPFAALSGAPNTPPKPGDRWLMNLYRINRIPVVEYSCFSPTLNDPANYHVPAKFGIIEFS